MTSPSPNEDLTRALAVVTELLRARGHETGANIGHALRKDLPGFTPQAFGFNSLSQMLVEAADDLVVVDRKGDDRVWALGEFVSDRDIEHALGPDASDTVSPASKLVPTRVELRNFRSCRNVGLDLDPAGLTVLVGPNGSGKSTVLFGSSFASQVTRGKLRALFSGTRDIRRLRSHEATGPLELAISAGAGVELRVKAEPLEDDTRFTVTLKNGKKVEAWSSPGAPPLLWRRPEAAIFWPSVLLRFRADALAAPSDVVEGEPRLSFDGTGLPTLLAYLANLDPMRLRKIVESVQLIVPDVEDTRQRLRRWEPHPAHAPAEPEAAGYQYLLDVKMRGDGWVPADLLSEGTLFAFGMHAVLQQQQPPRILIMDDIDRGLHPRAQRTLIQQLKAIAAAGTGPRIIVSTHSPYILDELPASSVRVVRAVDGATQLRPLVEHPEWQAWESSMTSGEFWTYVGDDWMEHIP